MSLHLRDLISTLREFHNTYLFIQFYKLSV